MSDDFYQQLSAKQLEAAVKAEAEIAELRRQLEIATAALEEISTYGECPYGCDTPTIAADALDAMKGGA